MNLVSNFVGSVSPSMFGKGVQGISPNIDLDDASFADLLEKQMNNIEQKNIDLSNSFELPTGINQVGFDGITPQFEINTESKVEPVKPVNEFENTISQNFNNNREMSTSEIVTFFNSLFDSKPTMTDTSRSGLFDFERKVAAGSYGKYSKNVITDLNEFVTDTIKMKS